MRTSLAKERLAVAYAAPPRLYTSLSYAVVGATDCLTLWVVPPPVSDDDNSNDFAEPANLVFALGGAQSTSIPTRLDVWTHAVVVFDSARHLATLYVGHNSDVDTGSPVIYDTAWLNTTASLLCETGGALVLGQDQDTVAGSFDPNQAFSGWVDDLRMWTVAMSHKQVVQIRTDAMLGYPDNTIFLHFTFDVPDITLGQGSVAVTEVCNRAARDTNPSLAAPDVSLTLVGDLVAPTSSAFVPGTGMSGVVLGGNVCVMVPSAIVGGGDNGGAAALVSWNTSVVLPVGMAAWSDEDAPAVGALQLTHIAPGVVVQSDNLQEVRVGDHMPVFGSALHGWGVRVILSIASSADTDHGLHNGMGVHVLEQLVAMRNNSRARATNASEVVAIEFMPGGVATANANTSESWLRKVTLRASRAPLAKYLDTTVREGETIPISLNARDPDGMPIAIHISQLPTLGLLDGIVNGPSGGISDMVLFSAPTGLDSSSGIPVSVFTYVTVDSTGDSSGEAQVMVHILPINDAASTPPSASETTAEDEPLVITLPAEDPESAREELVFLVLSLPMHGSLYQYTDSLGTQMATNEATVDDLDDYLISIDDQQVDVLYVSSESSYAVEVLGYSSTWPDDGSGAPWHVSQIRRAF